MGRPERKNTVNFLKTKYSFFLKVQKLQLEIHEKNKTLDDYRTRQEQEMSQLTHKHQMELMAKLQNAKEEQVIITIHCTSFMNII